MWKQYLIENRKESKNVLHIPSVYCIISIPVVYYWKGSDLMGCYFGALGRLKIVPEPTRELVKEYLLFSAYSCPDRFNVDEVFSNPWFFDKDNMLASMIGKFCEPEIWYEHLKENFFEKRGYQLIGDPQFVAEGDDIDIWELGNSRVFEWYGLKKHFEELYLKEE